MRTSLVAVLVLLAGCRSAYDRPRPERYDRPIANKDGLLFQRFELGAHNSHVLDIAGTPDVESVALRQTSTDGEASWGGEHYELLRGITDEPARRWLVEVRFRGKDPVCVAAIDVLQPTGLLLHCEGGCGTNRVLLVGLPGTLGPYDGRSAPFFDHEGVRATLAGPQRPPPPPGEPESFERLDEDR